MQHTSLLSFCVPLSQLCHSSPIDGVLTYSDPMSKTWQMGKTPKPFLNIGSREKISRKETPERVQKITSQEFVRIRHAPKTLSIFFLAFLIVFSFSSSCGTMKQMSSRIVEFWVSIANSCFSCFSCVWAALDMPIQIWGNRKSAW